MSHTVLQIVLKSYVRWQFPRLMRRVGLVVNTSDSGYGVASSSPDEGALSMPGCRRRRLGLWVNHAPSLTPAACYRAVCEAWSAYTDLKIALPYLIFPPAIPLSSPCVNQWTWMKLAVCLLWFSTNLRNIKFIYCLILDGTTELDC